MAREVRRRETSSWLPAMETSADRTQTSSSPRQIARRSLHETEQVGPRSRCKELIRVIKSNTKTWDERLLLSSVKTKVDASKPPSITMTGDERRLLQFLTSPTTRASCPRRFATQSIGPRTFCSRTIDGKAG